MRGGRQTLLRAARAILCLVLGLIGFMAFLTILAWLIGRVANDRFAWSQWLWWIPTPAALAATLIGLIASLRPMRGRRRRMARWIIAMVVVAIYFATIEHRMLRRPRMNNLGGAVRIVHWNITLQPYKPHVDDLVNELVALDGDITVLTNPGYAPWQPQVVDALGAGTPPVGMASLAVISRYPVSQPQLILTANAFDLLDMDQPAARAEHESADESQQRTNLSFMVSIVSVEVDTTAQLGRRLRMYMIDMPSDPRIPRMKLARAIRAKMDQSIAANRFPAPDIVIGDFNMPRGSASVAALFPGMREAYDDSSGGGGGHGYGASFHRLFPLWHIDHVLLGPKMECLRYDLVDPHLTRHDAQVAWIEAR